MGFLEIQLSKALFIYVRELRTSGFKIECT